MVFAWAGMVAVACGPDRGTGLPGTGGSGAGNAGGASSGTGGSGQAMLPGLEKLRIEPPEASVTITKAMGAELPFKAIGTFKGNKEKDVTADVLWRGEPFGTLNVTKGLASTKSPGQKQILATSGSVRAMAKLNVKLVEVLNDPAVGMPLPANPGAIFAGAAADDTKKPDIVYPNDGVLLPPNLFGIEFHFRPTSAAYKLFEVRFESPNLDLKVYTRCTQPAGVSGCIFQTDTEVWRYLTDAQRGLDPVSVTVRGSDEAGTTAGTSAPIKVQFSSADLLGAVYYWTTTEPTGIMRWDFGNPEQRTAEQIVRGGDNGTAQGARCFGCHAVSRDGNKMVVSAGGQNDGRLLLFDLKKKAAMQKFPLQQRSQFETWNPDGSQFAGVYGDGNIFDILLFDGTTGAVNGMIDVGEHQPDHPDWSPDGKTIAFTSVGGAHNTDQKSYQGAIFAIKREGQSWGAPEKVIDRVDGKNRYYPAIAPTNEFVVFNESTCPNGKLRDEDCDFDMDTTSKMFAIGFGGTATPVELTRANAPGIMDGARTAITNSYPKWSPFVFRLSEDRSLLWLTFTSRRAFGLRKANPVLLWMVGVDPARLAAGGDPSFPAFVLPFQDLESKNHIAQWAEKIPEVE
jgi:hypothetical protein